MCATTKYVSVTCQSNGTAAVTTPETTPITNSTTNPAAKSKGVFQTGLPNHMVAIHANTAIALGIVMRKLAPLKNDIDTAGSPVANMWCTHTPKPMRPVAIVDSATYGYPTSGRRQNVGIISDTMPMAGSTMM